MSKQKDDLRNWVEGWKRAGAELEKIRIKEMRESNTYESMQALSDAFDSAIAHFKIPSTSGLIEQQRYFMLLRKNALST
jgi:hypothetical protein